jgi:hypothetical protein
MLGKNLTVFSAYYLLRVAYASYGALLAFSNKVKNYKFLLSLSIKTVFPKQNLSIIPNYLFLHPYLCIPVSLRFKEDLQHKHKNF